jgi:hypothetical protein
MNKAIFYELFLKVFDDLQREQEEYVEQLRHGKNYRVLAQQLSDLAMRINQTEYIFEKMKVWFV